MMTFLGFFCLYIFLMDITSQHSGVFDLIELAREEYRKDVRGQEDNNTKGESNV
mgnify:FL=1